MDDIKACGNGDVAPLVLNLGCRAELSVYASSVFLWERIQRYPLNRNPSGTQIRCGCFGEVKNLLPIMELESSSCAGHSVVTIPTELSRHIIYVVNIFIRITYYCIKVEVTGKCFISKKMRRYHGEEKV